MIGPLLPFQMLQVLFANWTMYPALTIWLMDTIVRPTQIRSMQGILQQDSGHVASIWDLYLDVPMPMAWKTRLFAAVIRRAGIVQ